MGAVPDSLTKSWKPEYVTFLIFIYNQANVSNKSNNDYVYIYIDQFGWFAVWLPFIFNSQGSIPLWGARKLLSVGKKSEWLLSG